LQMVYVDEHTCIGCTNCAMIAQSTFFHNAGISVPYDVNLNFSCFWLLT
jgi:ferredoxin